MGVTAHSMGSGFQSLLDTCIKKEKKKIKRHVWYLPFWGRGKGSNIGAEVRAWVSQRTPWYLGSGFQSLPGTCISKKNKNSPSPYPDRKGAIHVFFLLLFYLMHIPGRDWNPEPGYHGHCVVTPMLYPLHQCDSPFPHPNRESTIHVFFNF